MLSTQQRFHCEFAVTPARIPKLVETKEIVNSIFPGDHSRSNSWERAQATYLDVCKNSTMHVKQSICKIRKDKSSNSDCLFDSLCMELLEEIFALPLTGTYFCSPNKQRVQ